MSVNIYAYNEVEQLLKNAENGNMKETYNPHVTYCEGVLMVSPEAMRILENLQVPMGKPSFNTTHDSIELSHFIVSVESVKGIASVINWKKVLSTMYQKRVQMDSQMKYDVETQWNKVMEKNVKPGCWMRGSE